MGQVLCITICRSLGFDLRQLLVDSVELGFRHVVGTLLFLALPFSFGQLLWKNQRPLFFIVEKLIALEQATSRLQVTGEPLLEIPVIPAPEPRIVPNIPLTVRLEATDLLQMPFDGDDFFHKDPPWLSTPLVSPHFPPQNLFLIRRRAFLPGHPRLSRACR